MTVPIAGGCLCGAVRYASSKEPIFTANCHCRDCQRSSGGAYVSVFMVPNEGLQVTGTLTYYDVIADSGNTFSRGFCGTCGTPLFGKSSGMPAGTIIKAGTLDDASWYRPALDIFTASAQPWACMNPELPKFPRSPRGPAG